MSLNNLQVIGHVGKDPEVKAAKTGGTSFTTFSVAVNKRGAKDEKPLWINVIAFGKTGEFAAKYLKKGSQVFVQGELDLQEYEGNDGKNHLSAKCVANIVTALDSKREGNTNASAASAGGNTTVSAATDDIPF